MRLRILNVPLTFPLLLAFGVLKLRPEIDN